MFYTVKTPWLLRKLFPGYEWIGKANKRVVYLTFDDGPHPEITGYVLDQLRSYKAKASFFCIGKNVVAYPGMFERIKKEGHAIGNHTHHHVNGWKHSSDDYLADIKEASGVIDSTMFRPPYGRIRRGQAKKIREWMGKEARIIMWTILSGDFDTSLTAKDCEMNVLKHVAPGSILVFHDSEKAWPRLKDALPVILEALKKQGFAFECL